MNRRWIGLLATGLWAVAWASDAAVPAAPQRAYRPVVSASIVQDKDFYLLTLIDALPDVRAAVADDPGLKAEAEHRRDLLIQARQSCKGDPACLVRALLWSDDDIDRLADVLIARLSRDGLIARLAEQHMRPSGRFQRYAGMEDPALVRQAFIDAAQGMNHILRVWALGEPPLYPLLDSISYPAGDKMWKDAIDDWVDVTLDDAKPEALFFQLPLAAALDVLYMNDRDEPARFEPLAKGENAAALAYARSIDWKAFPYPVMLIPGRSPTLADTALSPEAKMKLRLAARRFKDGLAPLIVVSGGFCFPSQTRFNEALEMKRELMRAHGVPERAILIDPHARHTTTNLRNTERLMFEIGAPLDRPILVTTTAYQSGYIEGQVFHDRCLRELGYPCFSDLKRLSLFDTALRLPIESLHRDARDPLDP